ncbi:unnamed protein product, partial [Thelazia callipaeda]|uniref:Uncharacterized protein n=1 Tax=Thelazia callipaeda TaxID=103827 RepID=A0A0N5CU00_THECL
MCGTRHVVGCSHEEAACRQSIRNCYPGSRCKGTSNVEPGRLQRAREPALH